MMPLTVSLALITAGLAIKSALYPFASWLPDAHGSSTNASSAILSGLVLKGHIFTIIKIFYRVVGVANMAQTHVCNALYFCGLAGIIVGSLSAIREDDIRRMVAFSSAAQIGYIYVGIGLGTQAGMAAALFHVLMHAVTKPLLFISASGLSNVSGGSKKFSDLQGAGYRNKTAGIAFSMGALSMVGIPLLAGFVSKLLFGMASVQSLGKTLPTLIVLAISTVLNAVYFLRTVIRIYRRAPQEMEQLQHTREQKGFAVAMVLLVGMNIVLGVCSDAIVAALEKGLRMFA